MCRWLAYSGSPILLKEALYTPAHSLVDQSLHSRLGAETTNGDGFGVGWYGDGHDAPPAVFRAVGPAWSDQNLRELAASVRSPLFLAHIRASTGTPVQQTNSHPFRHERWLWLHNGSIRHFATLKRDLMLAVDPRLYPAIAGSTDSEVMFFLALTFGLHDEPVRAVERMASAVEAVGWRNGVKDPLQMTVATTDGTTLWVFRYSSEGQSRSLHFTTDIETLRAMYPDNKALKQVSDETRIVVSEPLGDLVGAWLPMPEASYGIIQPGADELGEFQPHGG
jgi:predicted glutamine amidotransferase